MKRHVICLCALAFGLSSFAAESESGLRRIRVEKNRNGFVLQARHSQRGSQWFDLLQYVTDPALRPYFHPVRDPSGVAILTDDRPNDHPWQHGLFTGFHRVNGLNYWKEDEGRQRFVRLEISPADEQVSWMALTELVDTSGRVVLEEEDWITVYAPESPERYLIDFSFKLRAKNQAVTFGKFGVGGLAVRMPWDQRNPRQRHLNSNGLSGRECEQKRARWCIVERPLFTSGAGATVSPGSNTSDASESVFGFAIFDHPSNPNHPSGWRVDEQGLINPAISMLGDWSLPAGAERMFHYRVLVYKGPAQAEELARRFDIFASAPPRAHQIKAP